MSSPTPPPRPLPAAVTARGVTASAERTRNLRLRAASLDTPHATGSVRRRANDFGAAALVGDTVLGLTTADSRFLQTVAGRNVTDGVKRFAGPKVRYPALVPTGPGFAALVAEADNGKGFYALVSANGKLSRRTDGSYGARLHCWYDAASITVCALSGTQLLWAIDATTGADLWQLPATGRKAPEVTAAWHGAVYGTVSDEPIVVDAHTGTDKQTNPVLAPASVNGHAGVAAGADQATLSAHPTIG